jgi:hypothetical protein
VRDAVDPSTVRRRADEPNGDHPVWEAGRFGVARTSLLDEAKN